MWVGRLPVTDKEKPTTIDHFLRRLRSHHEVFATSTAVRGSFHLAFWGVSMVFFQCLCQALLVFLEGITSQGPKGRDCAEDDTSISTHFAASIAHISPFTGSVFSSYLQPTR